MLGIFLSRDAAELIPEEIESGNPYQYAYYNPLVYEDPSGLFTLMNLNVNLTARGNLQASRTTALRRIQREVIDELGEAATDWFLDWLIGTLALTNANLPNGLTPQKFGYALEKEIQNILCTSVQDLPVLWFEAGVNQRFGTVEDNGYNCALRNEPPKLPSVAKRRRPDFMVRNAEPLDDSVKTWAIGEVKRGLSTFYSTWKRKRRGQWDAIWRHAQSYGYPPHAVVIVAFNGGRLYHWKFLRREIRDRDKNIVGFILVLSKRVVVKY